MALNSPADKVVGTVICRSAGALQGGGPSGAVRFLDRTHAVERLRGVDIVRKAQLHRLGAVGDRAAADGRDQIGADLARRRGGLDHGAPRRVRRHPVEDAGEPVAERTAHLGDLVRRAVQRPAHHQKHALGIEPPRFLRDRLRGGLAEHHRLHRAKGDAPGMQHGQLVPPCARKRWAIEACIAMPAAMQSSFNIMRLEWHGAT